MTRIEEKRFIEGFVNGLCADDRCDLYAASCAEEKDGNLIIPLEAVCESHIGHQIADLTDKINAMLEGESLPYSAYVDINIVLTPEERNKE